MAGRCRLTLKCQPPAVKSGIQTQQYALVTLKSTKNTEHEFYSQIIEAIQTNGCCRTWEAGSNRNLKLHFFLEHMHFSALDWTVKTMWCADCFDVYKVRDNNCDLKNQNQLFVESVTGKLSTRLLHEIDYQNTVSAPSLLKKLNLEDLIRRSMIKGKSCPSSPHGLHQWKKVLFFKHGKVFRKKIFPFLQRCQRSAFSN